MAFAKVETLVAVFSLFVRTVASSLLLRLATLLNLEGDAVIARSK